MTTFPDTALPQLVAGAASFIGAFDVQLHGADNPYDSTRVYDAAQTVVASTPRNFTADRVDSKPGALVFNRAVTLKDGWKPG